MSEAAIHLAELAIHFAADGKHDGDDGNGDPAGDQRVLDRRGAILIGNKCTGGLAQAAGRPRDPRANRRSHHLAPLQILGPP
jgi:hypothetical protein